MPPANSPTDTRASTPPAYSVQNEFENSLNSNPYLQQLEEAISTPVPNLAATLNLTSRPDSTSDNPVLEPTILAPTEDAWDGRTVLHLSREEEVASSRPSDQELLRRSPYLTELEFQNTSTESLNAEIMQSQRSRLRETLDASDTTEVTGQYATSGTGPSRQTLYDWAAAINRSRSQSRSRRYNVDDNTNNDASDNQEHSTNTNILPSDGYARRDLDRALRNYRLARSALRSNRLPGSEVGTAQGGDLLLASWSQGTNERTETPVRSTFPFSEFIEQHRQDHQRRQVEQSRLQGERERNRSFLRPTKIRKSSDSFKRIRNTIKYLSALRDISAQGSLTLSQTLGLDSLYASEELNTPNDLPMTIESLPLPQQSSWLQPGMVWQGLQSTEREQPSAPYFTAERERRERHREAWRRAIARRGIIVDNVNEGSGPTASATAVLDAERYLSDLLQDTHGRWSFGQPEIDSSRSNRHVTASPTQDNTSTEPYHWPVKVTLHSVDFDNMTVSGTMAASQIPDKLVTSISPLDQRQEGKSMESFFEGEIIDFRKHTLESEGRGYKVGGIDVDARYWARLGPFRQEIERVGVGNSSRSKISLSKFIFDKEDSIGDSTQDAKVDEVMAMCLGSQKWIEEKLGKEWILMRWKERCFITPVPPTDTNNGTYSTSSSYSFNNTSQVYTTGPNSHPNSTTWGLTIIGFYYIALHRQTGEIDGLYYDPGSQPYQQLKMTPDMAPRNTPIQQDTKTPDFPSSATDPKTQTAKIGMRSWFPSVEFR